jgi:hypothetical protein
VHTLEKSAEIVIVALGRKSPRRTVSTNKLRPARLAEGIVKSKYARLHSASTIVGVVYAPIDGARLDPYSRGLANPLARNLHAVTHTRGKVATEEPSNTTMRSVVLHWTAHRGDDGIPASARHRVRYALPDWTISTSLEFAYLLAIVRDIALESR